MFLMRKKAAAVIAALALTGAVFAQDCKPSKWGPNDEIGAANYITPQRVLAATQLVKMGQTHPLGIVIEPGMPAFPPPKCFTSNRFTRTKQWKGFDQRFRVACGL